jgi:predicted phosphoadenosine phosphosulfate sulfurtransferase
MTIKEYQEYNVLVAARQRVKTVFDEFEKVYISFSGGKDSTVMMHLVMEEAVKRNKTVGVLIIDLEAQYNDTIKHINNMIDMYRNNIDLHWVAVPMLLRNAVSNFEPRWICWDEDKKDIWVRDKPRLAREPIEYSFYQPKMEFEEFMVLWGDWYAQGKLTAAFIGIRADESLHRYCAIARNKTGLTYKGYKWTTLVTGQLYNIYPIYDWRTEDIWIFHGKYQHLPHNKIYDKMNMAGVKLSQQRLCQPYGDDQRRGLWLYHILEPETWYKVVARVNGANSGALYVQENGNMTGYNKVTKPDHHTWESFTNLLLKTLPKKTREHYKKRFKKFISGWQDRGYQNIPDEAPIELENKCWSPSWRRMAKCILRNDYWCKSLGQTQPKSDAYIQFKEIKAKRKMEKEVDKAIITQVEIFE